jgi:hypothetical protein
LVRAEAIEPKDVALLQPLCDEQEHDVRGTLDLAASSSRDRGIDLKICSLDVHCPSNAPNQGPSTRNSALRCEDSISKHIGRQRTPWTELTALEQGGYDTDRLREVDVEGLGALGWSDRDFDPCLPQDPSRPGALRGVFKAVSEAREEEVVQQWTGDALSHLERPESAQSVAAQLAYEA